MSRLRSHSGKESIVSGKRLAEKSNYLKDAVFSLNSKIRDKIYYHGTYRTKYGENILEDKYIKVPEKEGGQKRSPIVGRAYFTKELDDNALNNVIGTDVKHVRKGEIKISKETLEEEGKYGFLSIVKGTDLSNDIQADEDNIGLLVYKFYKKSPLEWKWLGELVGNLLAKGDIDVTEEDIGYFEEEGDVTVATIIGKAVIEELRRLQKSSNANIRNKSLEYQIQLIEASPNISHLGKVGTAQIWKFDKEKSSQLKPENFFDLAEPIYPSKFADLWRSDPELRKQWKNKSFREQWILTEY